MRGADGGAAFPAHYGYAVGDVSELKSDPGMSYRDWLAGQALAGYAGRSGICWQDTKAVAAEGRFHEIADAVIAAQNKVE